MAEIAAVFHWPRSEMDVLYLEELVDERNRAVALWNKMNGDGK